MLSRIKGRTKLNSQATASIWYIASNLLSRGVGFVFTPIFTRLLTPSEYGIYSLYVSLMGIFTAITTLEMSGSVIYRGIAKFEDEGCESFISSALGAETVLSIFFLTLYIVFRKRINAITSLSTALTVFLLVQIFINTAEGFYFAKERYFGRYKTVSLINISVGLITPLLSLAFIFFGLGGESRIIAPLITSGAVTLPIILRIIKNGKRLFSRDGWKFIFRITLPMLPHYLSLSLIAQSDKIIIARLVGSEAVGKYSAAYSIGFMLSLITGGLSLALTPWMMRKLKEGRTETVRSAISAASGAVIYSTLIFLSVMPEIFRIAVGGDYYEALPVAYVVAVSVIFSFLSSALTNCILHTERTSLITKNSLISASVSLLSGFMLIKSFGYTGGAYATFISYVLLYALNSRTSKKVIGIDIVGANESLRLFFILLFFATLIFLLRASFFARIIIIFALILMALPKVSECKRILL